MRRIVWIVVIMAVCSVAYGGFVLTEENDAFSGSDDQYTQGLELKYLTSPKNSVRYGYGARNLIYTPRNISIEEDQPDERPWAGVSALFVERWKREHDFIWLVEVSAGMVGKYSYSDEIQTWFHELCDFKTPRGWDNQIPDEFFVNLGGESYTPVGSLSVGHFSADLTMRLGGQFGTAFINADAGVLARAGFGVPEDYKTGLVKPTDSDIELSAYVFCELTGRVVLHNVTLGGSLWQDGPKREMVPLVSEARTGVAVGLLNARGYDVGVSCSWVVRSPEFEQQEEPVDFGSIVISVARSL